MTARCVLATLLLLQGCVKIHESVRYNDVPGERRTELRDRGAPVFRPTSLAWSEGTTAELAIEQHRPCRLVRVETVTREVTRTRVATANSTYHALLLVTELLAALVAVGVGPYLLATGETFEDRAAGGAATGVGGLLLGGFTWTALAARDRGPNPVAIFPRVTPIRVRTCDHAPASDLRLTARLLGREIPLGATGTEGVLRVDLAPLVPTELLEEMTSLDELRILSGRQVLGEIEVGPLIGLADEHEWQRALRLDSRDAFARYLARFARGRHSVEATVRLGAIDSEAAWQAAVAADTAEAYRGYLRRHAASEHAEEARAMVAYHEALSADTVAAWQAFLRDHPGHARSLFAQLRLAELTADSDGDGILDVRDLCVAEAETHNGHDDADGCPDVDPSELAVLPPASDVVWAPRGELPADTVAVAADATDPGWLWLVTASGRVLRMRLGSSRVEPVARVPVAARSVHALPGGLVVVGGSGAVWLVTSAGGVRWVDRLLGDSARVAHAVTCDRTRLLLATPSGLFAVGLDGSIELTAPGEFVHVVCAGEVPFGVLADGSILRVAGGGPRAIGTLGGPAHAVAHFDGAFYFARAGVVLRWLDGQTTPVRAGLPARLVARALLVIGAELYLLATDGTVLRLLDGAWRPALPGVEGMSVKWLLATRRGEPLMLAFAGRPVLLGKAEVRGRRVLAGAVLFATDSAEAGPDLVPAVRRIHAEWRERPARRIRIEGHTDSRGGRGHNLRLSLARAATVRALLVEQGVPAWAISTAGYGPDRPVADNQREEGRRRNRRVEVAFIE